MPHCSHCGKEGAKHKCTYCKDAVYCNEQCQIIGWHAHADDCNVINVPEPNMTAFVPYFGEDIAAEDFVERLNPDGPTGQSYLVQYVDPAGAIVQHVVEPVGANVCYSRGGSKLGYGAAPSEKLMKFGYSIKLTMEPEMGETYQTVTIPDLIVGETAIYKGAGGLHGALAKLNLARFANRDSSTLVLWPGVDNLQDAIAKSDGFDVPNTGGQLRIQLLDDRDKEISKIHGVFCFEKYVGGKSRVFRRGLKSLQPFQSEFKKKLGRGNTVTASLSNLEMLRATNSDGVSVQLIFEVTRDRNGLPKGTVTLLDIEIQTPLRPFENALRQKDKNSDAPPYDEDNVKSASRVEFALDADNLDHMQGLVMALEHKMAIGDIVDFDQQFDTLNEHREKLEKAIRTDADYETPAAVHNLVRVATQMCWEQIGIRWKAALDKNYYKMHKDDDLDALTVEVDTMGLPDLKDANWKTRFKTWAKGSRGKYKGRMRAIQKIIKERKLTHPQESDALNALNRKLATALATKA